jgi:hypothetical protein
MRATLRLLQEDLVAFRDPERLRSRLAEFELGTPDDFDDVEQLAALMEAFQPPRRRRKPRS